MTPQSSLQAGMKFKDKNEDIVSIVSVNDNTTILKWDGHAPQAIYTSSWWLIHEGWGLSLIGYISPPPPFTLDSWTAVDPDNLPTDIVVARGKSIEGSGLLMYFEGDSANLLKEDGRLVSGITHYILLSDMDKLVKP